MAVSLADSVGHYALADTTKKLSHLNSSFTYATVTIDATGSPAGGPCFKAVSTGAAYLGPQMAGVYVDSGAGVYTGFRYKSSAFASTQIIMDWVNGAGAAQYSLVAASTALTAYTRGMYYADPAYQSGGSSWLSSAVLLGTSSTCLVENAWHWIETYSTCAASGAVFQVWVDGVLVLDLSGLDTNSTGSTTITRIGFGFPVAAYSTSYMGEIYVGTARLGQVRIDPHFPDANGSDSTMTRSTGGDDYALVDETQANTTDYLSSDAVGEHTSVNVEALRNAGGTIKAVQVSAYLYKANAGTAGIKPYVLRGGSRYYGDEWFPAWASWKFFRYVWDNDPVTAAAWTESNFNSSEFGLERTT